MGWERTLGPASSVPADPNTPTLCPPSPATVLVWIRKVRGHSQRGQEDQGSLFLLADRAGRPRHAVQRCPEVRESRESPVGDGWG